MISHENFVLLIGYSATVINTIAIFPQARIIYQTSNTRAISLLMYIAIITAGLLWIVYGIMKNDFPIIIGNAISLIMSVYVFFKKVFNIIRSRKDNSIENE